MHRTTNPGKAPAARVDISRKPCTSNPCKISCRERKRETPRQDNNQRNASDLERRSARIGAPLGEPRKAYGGTQLPSGLRHGHFSYGYGPPVPPPSVSTHHLLPFDPAALPPAVGALPFFTSFRRRRSGSRVIAGSVGRRAGR